MKHVQITIPLTYMFSLVFSLGHSLLHVHVYVSTCVHLHVHVVEDTCTTCTYVYMYRSTNATCVLPHFLLLSLPPISHKQGYQKVPETPLASCSVLKEDQDVWMDVQVRALCKLGLPVALSCLLGLMLYGWHCVRPRNMKQL